MKVQSLVVCLFVILSGGLLYGQGGANGTILGTVTDNSGAVVGNAKVDVTNMGTGVATHAETSANGDFTAPYLAPGIYSVTVQAAGFQKAVADNITLVVAQQARVNVVMKPGQVSETVEVQASSVSLDTDSAAVSQLVSQKQVEQLPLNGRNFLNLLFIGAGAVQTTGEQGQMRQGEGNAISINGGRPTSNNYTLDGLVNTDTALNTPAVILSQDAIQEFKVQSETYSAEYGFSANQVNIVSKSGSNQLHGTVFEFLRNDAFDAKAPFQSAIPELRQNQFGFVVGGPIYIPKVYDGRNKTFFLVNYEGWRIRNGINQSTFNVPNPAWLQGDFSASGLSPAVAAGGTCIPSATQFCMPIDPTTGASFPGNVIPAARFSRLANVALGAGLFPAPNCFSAGCLGDYRLTTTLPNTVDQQTYKLDQQLGRFGSVFFRYTTATYDNQNINGSVSLPFGIGTFHEKGESWMISHTIPLTHSLVNNFRFGRLEAVSIQGGIGAPASDVTALGLTGVFPNLPDYARTYPGLGFQAINGTAFGSQGNDVTTSDIPTWEFADSLSMTHGKHTIAVGFDYRRWVQKRDLSNDFLGQFNFNNDTITSNTGGCTNPGGNCGTGNSVADFLLGYYHDASTFQPGPFSPTNVAGNLNQYHFQYFAPYIQDDWKVTSRLTLNLGLRWDYRSVPYEQDNKMFWFDRANPLGGLCYADKGLGTTDVTGLGGPIAPDGNGFYRYCGRNNPAAASKKPFAPRVGFAYRLGDKTVLRGGYGIFFDSAETREIDDSGDIYPFVVRASPGPTTDPTLPKLTDNMFPAVPLHKVTPALDGSQFFAVIISEFPHNPYVQQWSLSVQRELARNTTLEVNYVGNKGTHLLNRTNYGQGLAPVNPALCDPSTGGDPTNADCPVAARRPFANITSANGFLGSQWNGYSSYNAGNVKLERRSNSIALVAVYTWAKSLDDKSAAAGVGSTNAFAGHMNENDQALDYGRSDFDVSQRFVTSLVYQLPVGRGRHFGSNMNRAADLAIGGWQVTAITTFQAGFPYSVLANDKLNLLTTFTQRANIVPGCDPNSGFHKSITEYFNTSCFTQPLAGQFGNSGRDILRGPGINNWDMGIGKDFKFTERVAFQFRAEAFNVFNHAQYGYDPNTATSINAPIDNNPNDAKYGQVIAARPGRILQLGGKIVF
jgi:outer membrane receptor protein involved in Fe transport